MLVAWVFTILLNFGQSQNILPPEAEDNQELHQCVTSILDRYFNESIELTYVNMESDNEDLLQTVYKSQKFSLVTRNSTYQSVLPNYGYLIITRNVNTFKEYFKYLQTDTTWNPYARFLIIIQTLVDEEIKSVFDILLRKHVNNVIVMNGTTDAHLFAYNPFDNYACGKYYTDIIDYGPCKENTNNFYPNKLVTGLKNCTFRAAIVHRPPFTVNPLKAPKIILGTEEYILKALAELEHFEVKFNYSVNPAVFSSAFPNMTAFGPMEMLQNNETDVIFGGNMMVLTRGQAFSFLSGYHDYNDELRFVVKRASLVPLWKTVYIEFDTTVWMLILLALVVYSFMVIYLLQTKDKGFVFMELLDNLLTHSRDIRCSMTIKCILMIWVMFAYLINTCYQSSLFSLTTNPSKEHQVASEEDIIQYKYKPCFSVALKTFLSLEITEGMLSTRSSPADIDQNACSTTIQAITTVSKTKGVFSLIPNYIYLYNKPSFNDKFGNPLIYYFDKPFAKFLYCFYFYKGFPISNRMRMNAIRMRENGLADKSMKDHFFKRALKQRFSQQEFETRFVLPWGLYIIGCTISIITFLVEYMSQSQLKMQEHHVP
ncbi:uncharacterized protein LOC124629849 [Helicoverpa zea]|uniref:uncharacterized protein LOC124629849 n=1 Tax=Helicoverpa zea TaxID=7113 RepID=UPI001F58D623|nr:uncharacterized protein LOC124629849 [Helicoverpa zea]